VELNILADIGLVGLPNAGKSSLLDFFTNARPKIAPYPFTTKIPNLGVLRVDDERDIIIADIPGIIEGASEGAGLGIRFLKHISRTQGLACLIDLSDDNYLEALDIRLAELKQFSDLLEKKPRIVLANKLDVEGTAERLGMLREKCPDEAIVGMSIYSKEGMDQVRKVLMGLAESVHADDPKRAAGGIEAKPRQSTFLQERSVDGSGRVDYPGRDYSSEDN
jgi:GTP-binding protein